MEHRFRTRRVLTLGAVVAGAMLLSGCGYWPRAGNNGAFYTNVTTPVTVLEPEATDTRRGEACSVGILGLFASGNSSIEAAKNRAGIERITVVEERYRQYMLGAYSQYCVLVSGTE